MRIFVCKWPLINGQTDGSSPDADATLLLKVTRGAPPHPRWPLSLQFNRVSFCQKAARKRNLEFQADSLRHFCFQIDKSTLLKHFLGFTVLDSTKRCFQSQLKFKEGWACSLKAFEIFRNPALWRSTFSGENYNFVGELDKRLLCSLTIKQFVEMMNKMLRPNVSILEVDFKIVLSQVTATLTVFGLMKRWQEVWKSHADASWKLNPQRLILQKLITTKARACLSTSVKVK